jgi:hypothetical protein
MVDDLFTRDKANIKRIVSELEDAILSLQESYEDPDGKLEEALELLTETAAKTIEGITS